MKLQEQLLNVVLEGLHQAINVSIQHSSKYLDPIVVSGIDDNSLEHLVRVSTYSFKPDH